MNEANIVINGQFLTQAQSTTVRVALDNFVLYLETNGLGKDDHGQSMKAAYLERIDEIRQLIFSNAV